MPTDQLIYQIEYHIPCEALPPTTCINYVRPIYGPIKRYLEGVYSSRAPIEFLFLSIFKLLFHKSLHLTLNNICKPHKNCGS